MYENLGTMEDIIRNKFGYKFNYDQISNINNILRNSEKILKLLIENFINKNFYNYKNTIDFIDKNYSNICI